MPEYAVVFARSARRDLVHLPAEVVARILPRIEALAGAPRPPGCIKLRGSTGLWRIRIGDYRVIYSVSDTDRIVDISAVVNRKDAY